MYQVENISEERKISRSDKILEAKSAFTPGGQSTYNRRAQDTFSERKKHSFGLFRMLMAGMLFLVLISAFHFNFSYHGFNKEYVKEVLADNSQWEKLVNQVSQVMKFIDK